MDLIDELLLIALGALIASLGWIAFLPQIGA